MSLVLLASTALAQTEPNLLLVVVDDIGVDRLVRYQGDVPGYVPVPDTTPVTPLIDALVDDGVRFRQAWSNPLCSPTRAGLLTGRHAYRTGVGYVANQDFPTGHLERSETTLAETLDPIYTTALFGKWHLGDDGLDADGDDDPTDWDSLGDHDAIPSPNLHGFEVFDGSLYGGVWQYWTYRRVAAYDYGYLNLDEHSEVTVETTYATELLVDNASAFLTTAPEPFFGMISFQAPHDADPGYDPAHALQGCSTITTAVTDSEVYRAMIECVDHHLDRLLADLDAVGRLDDTVIVLLGDNGTEPSVGDPDFPRSADGKGTAYESGIRVPLIVAEGKHLDATPYGYRYVGAPYVPGDRVPTGRVSNRLVSTVDVHDTLLELAGLPQTGQDSVSFAPVLISPTAPGRSVVYTEEFDDVGDLDGIYEGSAALRTLRYKLIVWQEDDGTATPCQRSELYDLVTDRAEANDLYDSPAHALLRDAFRADLDQRVTAWESNPANPPHWLWRLADGPRTTGACP